MGKVYATYSGEQELKVDETVISENETTGMESDTTESVLVESTETTSEPVPEPTLEKENIQTVSPEDTAVLSASFDINNIPAYSGSAYVVVNDSVPYFTDAEMQTASYE